MKRLQIFQLVVIFVFLFLLYAKMKKESTFTATLSLVIPWTQPQEKNKIYIYMRDPLGFDLRMTYKEANSSAKAPYDWSKGFNKVKVRDRILIDESDRLDLLEKVDGCVSLQNTLVDDLDKVLLNMNTMYPSSYTGITRDYNAVTKVNVTETTKYKRLVSGVAEGGSIIQCGTFYPMMSSTSVYNADYFWETSPKYVGAFNNDIKGDVIFYKNWGDEYDIYDESSVTFTGSYGSLGRWSKKMNATEKNEFKNQTDGGKLWSASFWKEVASKPPSLDLGSYVKQGLCMFADCLSYTTYKGNLVEPDGWYNQYVETSKAIFMEAVNVLIAIAILNMIAPVGYLFALTPQGFIVTNYIEQFVSAEIIQNAIFKAVGIDILAWMDTFDWVIVYRTFPPVLPNGQLYGNSATLTYINLQNSIESSKIPYLRQRFKLKKQYTYFLSFYFFGFVPLIVNFIDTTTGEKTEILSQNDVSYNEWIYRSAKFRVSEDKDYYIEFTLNVIGDNVKYPGSDPDNNNHRWNGRSIVDNVVLEVIDEDSSFDNYSQFTFSNDIRDDEVFISMNGKIQKISLSNSLNSSDTSKTNERRAMITDFITTNYIA